MKICPLCHSKEFEPIAIPIPCDAKSTDTRCSPCTTLTDLDKRIEEAHQTLIDLAVERQRLLVEVNQEHDPLTNRLPPELSSQIFEQYSADSDNWVYTFPKPILLAQVCQSWRTICHSTPGLWTTLRIWIVGNAKETKWNNWNEVATSWLRRCRDILPLSIFLLIDADADPHGPYCISIYEIIQSYSHRLKYLNIDATLEVIQILCSRYQEKITLPSLRIQCTSEEMADDFRGSITFVAQKLYLGRVTLRGVGVDARSLTHVEIVSLSIDDCVQLFTLAIHMVSCALSNISWGSGRQSSHPLIRKALKELDIKGNFYSDSTTSILDMVNLPSLEQLSVEMSNGDQGEVFTALIDHLQRSESHLATLSISNLGDLRSTSLNDLTHTVGRSLRHLHLATSNWSGDGTQIAATLKASLNDWANLESVTLFSSKGSWTHILREIVSFGSAMASRHLRNFSVTLWSYSWQSPLDPETEKIVLDRNRGDNALPPVEPTEIEAIISAMKTPLLSVRIEVTKRHKYDRIDITNDVVEALRRYIEEIEGR